MTELKPKVRIFTAEPEPLRKLAAADPRFEVDHFSNDGFHYVLVDARDDDDARTLAVEVFCPTGIKETDVVTVHPQAPTIDRFSLPVRE